MGTKETRVKLQSLIDDNRLISKKSTNNSYHSIDREVKKGVYFVTPYHSVIATDSEAQRWFVEKVYSGEIMDFLQVQMRHNLLTKYAVDKACANGQFDKFTGFGRGCVLYINKTI